MIFISVRQIGDDHLRIQSQIIGMATLYQFNYDFMTSGVLLCYLQSRTTNISCYYRHAWVFLFNGYRNIAAASAEVHHSLCWLQLRHDRPHHDFGFRIWNIDPFINTEPPATKSNFPSYVLPRDPEESLLGNSAKFVKLIFAQ